MPTPSKSPVAWRKSSRSNGSGGNNCVEVGAWRKSSRSNGNGGNACVEVGSVVDQIAVRDTKHHASGILAVPTTEWAAFLDTLKDS